jgi:hypothetical protein
MLKKILPPKIRDLTSKIQDYDQLQMQLASLQAELEQMRSEKVETLANPAVDPEEIKQKLEEKLRPAIIEKMESELIPEMKQNAENELRAELTEKL